MSPVFIRTYGCQMNEYESEVMAGILERAGFEIADDGAAADVILLNTCSVRQHAEDRVWGALFGLKERAQREPGLIVGVCGCMAQARAEEIMQRCPHVRLLCGTKAFARIGDLVTRAAGSRGLVIDTDLTREPCLTDIPKKRVSTLKAFVPVMRGCDNYCAYCVVPYVRGCEKSRSPREILAEVQGLAKDGCREVTLLGQNVNSYRGTDYDRSAPVAFAGLLCMVSSVEGIDRIRFMTSHPKDFPADLIRAMVEIPQVCEHLHLPLQSGSDRVLERMNRKYTFASYRSLVDELRAAAPGVVLGTDVITGFPGETRDDFQKTVRAMKEIAFDSAFIFKYSDREGTQAAALSPKVPDGEIVRRHAALLALQEKIGLQKNGELVGKSVEVLVEGTSPRNPGRLFGRTRTNKRVVFEGEERLIGGLVCVTIREVTPLTLIGALPRARAAHEQP